MEIDVFLALTSAGVPHAEARAAAEAIRKEGDQIRDAQKELATKGDLSLLKAELKTDMANLRSELSARFVDMQRSTTATMFGGFGMMAAVMALFHYLH